MNKNIRFRYPATYPKRSYKGLVTTLLLIYIAIAVTLLLIR